MNIHFDFSLDLIAYITEFLAWCVIGFIVYRIYKKQAAKPKVWKVIVSVLVGIFCISINLQFFGAILKIPILPLGVWILYGILKRMEGRWQIYRRFAWLGFWANFIFLAATLIAIPAHLLLYPEDEVSTYISNVENAAIINIHPSAGDHSLNIEKLQSQLHNMRQETSYSEEWYEETYKGADSKKINERFPYQLSGTLSKWGSGVKVIIYVEADGKGILVTAPNKQLYFRCKDSLLKGGK
ncbi:hypothetical protein ACFVSW_17150 [Neobacillus sp. NPDC058068]|uniref:hypothetical protein n=1 Tax=Neobacillus sp. NPDC058068 TaxID=3346325 RepID=UPI0036DC0685